MKTSKTDAVRAFIVMSVAGVLDREATIAAFTSAVDNYESLNKVDEDSIRATAVRLLGAQKGKIQQFAGVLANEYMKEHDLPSAAFADTTKRVAGWVKSVSGQYGRPGKLLGVQKGPSGGTFLWANCAANSKEVLASKKFIVDAPKKLEEKNAKLAKKNKPALTLAQYIDGVGDDEETDVEVEEETSTTGTELALAD